MTGTEKEASGGAAAGSRGCFCMGMGPELSEMMRKLGPPEEVRQHFRNARIEMLKGIRAMIDARIERLSRQEEKGTAVPVE